MREEMMSEQTASVKVKEKSAQPNRFSRMRETLSVLLTSKTAVVGLIIVLFWVFVAIFAPYMTSYTP
ncbi:hypothetical protein GF339_08510, partial [candidate division KSB3 bacterium]|nr:hypothetical protein [candidate division KSB3 bacterium]MBD3324612.1 hypothetical protein [candidate division KSB3 bacterium]